MTADHRTTWETYVAAWKATADDDKRALFRQCLAEDCEYFDPLAHARGWSELAAYMSDFHTRIPGGHFVTDHFVAHHGRSIATWSMFNGIGARIGTGISYGEYGDNGRLVRMVGFFEAPEPAR